jgi:hypothetical protein
MSQSALVVGLLALAFILYVAARGRLPSYTAVLWGSPAKPASGSGTKSSGGLLDTITSLFKKAAPVAVESFVLG